ncbi:MAG: cytochrome P450, partial [Actinomycetota bacterium]|nr:cytochrome P450 [Actinomycetota bacterium]
MSAPEAIDGTYDPFEEFNRSVGAGVVEDPYPLLAMARAKGPLLKENLEAELLAAEVDPQVTMGPEVFTAFSYDAVQTVLRDGETFSSAGYADVMGAVMGHTILEMDEPEHHTYRGLVQQAFSRKAMERWEEEAVGPIVDECIDAFIERGNAELVRELTLPFPVNVIASMLGLPRADLPQFHRWA